MKKTILLILTLLTISIFANNLTSWIDNGNGNFTIENASISLVYINKQGDYLFSIEGQSFIWFKITGSEETKKIIYQSILSAKENNFICRINANQIPGMMEVDNIGVGLGSW